MKDVRIDWMYELIDAKWEEKIPKDWRCTMTNVMFLTVETIVEYIE